MKHAYNLSDEKVVEGYLENPYWQHFCGNEYFEHDSLVIQRV
ncbi:transposase PF05598 domain protein [Leptospira noguchii serovar Panama str. CZ214]|uniref:Transposase PF05598 domain protein n=1 Tax=Leptospira noguchii serovar Panama str. CZ214 TaxID=1001595 RepID=T0FV54_9LEPT|nr:transposase PF05598 domain protein [Leptospira noguchii serovar Panama str. CZ214]